MAQTGIQHDDPMFLVMISLDNYYALVEDALKSIKAERELIASKTVRLEGLVDTFVEKATTLDCRLKGQIPRSFSNSGLLIKELTVAILVAFLAGGFFFRPLLGLGLSFTCHNFPRMCEVEE